VLRDFVGIGPGHCAASSSEILIRRKLRRAYQLIAARACLGLRDAKIEHPNRASGNFGNLTQPHQVSLRTRKSHDSRPR